jgi:hypothetical protein
MQAESKAGRQFINCWFADRQRNTRSARRIKTRLIFLYGQRGRPVEPENSKGTYRGLLGLDNLPIAVKVFNWVISFMFATCVSLIGSYRVWQAMPSIFIWIAAGSPIFAAVGWLRLTGVKWRHALLLFVFVPAVYLSVIFIIRFLAAIIATD